MLGAALALIFIGLALAGWALWQMGGAGVDWPSALFLFGLFLVGGVLLVVGLFLLSGVFLWTLFG